MKEICCHFCDKTASCEYVNYPMFKLPEGWIRLSPVLGGWFVCPHCGTLLDKMGKETDAM
jgi:hypothetical protein